mgnify:CR=1 FL=1
MGASFCSVLATVAFSLDLVKCLLDVRNVSKRFNVWHHKTIALKGAG